MRAIARKDESGKVSVWLVSREQVPADLIKRSSTLAQLKRTRGRSGQLPFARSAIDTWRECDLADDAHTASGKTTDMRSPAAIAADVEVADFMQDGKAVASYVRELAALCHAAFPTSLSESVEEQDTRTVIADKLHNMLLRLPQHHQHAIYKRMIASTSLAEVLRHVPPLLRIGVVQACLQPAERESNSSDTGHQLNLNIAEDQVEYVLRSTNAAAPLAAGFSALCQQLPFLPTLQEVHMHGQGLDEENVAALSLALSRHSHLSKLTLGLRLHPSACLPVLARALPQWRQLRSLKVSRQSTISRTNNIPHGDRDAQRGALLLAVTALRALTQLELHVETAGNMRSLCSLPALRHLSLCATEENARYLAAAPYDESQALHTLELRQSASAQAAPTFTHEAYKALWSVLGRCTALTRLQLHVAGDGNVSALCLGTLTNLLHLELADVGADPEVNSLPPPGPNGSSPPRLHAHADTKGVQGLLHLTGLTHLSLGHRATPQGVSGKAAHVYASAFAAMTRLQWLSVHAYSKQAAQVQLAHGWAHVASLRHLACTVSEQNSLLADVHSVFPRLGDLQSLELLLEGNSPYQSWLWPKQQMVQLSRITRLQLGATAQAIRRRCGELVEAVKQMKCLRELRCVKLNLDEPGSAERCCVKALPEALTALTLLAFEACNFPSGVRQTLRAMNLHCIKQLHFDNCAKDSDYDDGLDDVALEALLDNVARSKAVQSVSMLGLYDLSSYRAQTLLETCARCSTLQRLVLSCRRGTQSGWEGAISCFNEEHRPRKVIEVQKYIGCKR